MNKHYSLIVIGAGPSGLAAAITAANVGIDCAVLDEQATLGGQIYRSIESVPEERAKQLGSEYTRGRELALAFKQCRAEYYANTSVWSLNNEREIGILQNGQASTLTADKIIITTGAMERPVPFQGWTKPGVMQAGAGQILFKSAGVVPDNGVVLAGSGPLLLLLANQYIQAGVKVKALLDVTPLKNHFSAILKLPKALLASHYLIKGAALQLGIMRAKVPMYFGVQNIQAQGHEILQSVSFTHSGKDKSIETDLLLTHFGVIPHTWLTQAAGCEHKWDDSQQCWRPVHDLWGHTSIEGVFVSGDGAGINGARSAEHAGRIVGLEVAFELNKISQLARDKQSAVDRKWKRKEHFIRPFLEAYYKIPKRLLMTQDDSTIVCRCEEVTAGAIRQAVKEGHENSNQVKFFTRCGMGPCQGRQCSNAVAHIVGHSMGQSAKEVGHFRGRPPVTPLTIGQLAELNKNTHSHQDETVEANP